MNRRAKPVSEKPSRGSAPAKGTAPPAGSARRVMARQGKGAPPKPGGREAVRRVKELAACDMTFEEIAAVLGWKLPLQAKDEQALREALEMGRLLGRAKLKEALYEAATQGKLQAQRELLLRLEEEGIEEGDEHAFEVRRIILGADGQGPETDEDPATEYFFDAEEEDH